MIATALIEMAERGWLADRSIRSGIRRLLRQRLQQQPDGAEKGDSERQLAAQLADGPLTVHVDDANRQHYEVPAPFFQFVLGSHLKYSCGYWPDDLTTLDESELAMLKLTTERATIVDGMSILELGCGWGSLTLHMAQQFPNAKIVGVSNSHSQRKFIERRCQERGLRNVRIVTTDIAAFQTTSQFDRVVSVEMFEHVRNHRELLRRISTWLTPQGRLFVHIFCHRDQTYLFETRGSSNWMGRHFFTGGMMPSTTWLPRFHTDLSLVRDWLVDGRHYQRTSEAWLARLDKHRDEVSALFEEHFSPRAAQRQIQRWRMFFLACSELFGYNEGQEWFVQHSLWERTN